MQGWQGRRCAPTHQLTLAMAQLKQGPERGPGQMHVCVKQRESWELAGYGFTHSGLPGRCRKMEPLHVGAEQPPQTGAQIPSRSHRARRAAKRMSWGKVSRHPATANCHRSAVWADDASEKVLGAWSRHKRPGTAAICFETPSGIPLLAIETPRKSRLLSTGARQHAAALIDVRAPCNKTKESDGYSSCNAAKSSKTWSFPNLWARCRPNEEHHMQRAHAFGRPPLK